MGKQDYSIKIGRTRSSGIRARRKDAKEPIPSRMNGALPRINDSIVYNVLVSDELDGRVYRHEERGCCVITGVYPNQLIGMTYKDLGMGRKISFRVCFLKNDFLMKKIRFVKIDSVFCSNEFKYEDLAISDSSDPYVASQNLCKSLRMHVIGDIEKREFA